MKHRKPGRPKKVTLPLQPERYFQRLTDVELGELLVKELASSARAYIDAHGSESLSHGERESLLTTEGNINAPQLISGGALCYMERVCGTAEHVPWSPFAPVLSAHR